MVAKRRQAGAPNTTSRAFGAGRREKHESYAFYDRFDSPIVDEDTLPQPATFVDQLVCGDSRSMPQVADDSVALVVTSPPYFVGKVYEQEIATGVPQTYLDYLAMLTEVFRECVRVLEPGGRIAVNVANLGRRPYRSLSSDVVSILQDQLGLLLRGEIVWQKAEGATSSCAWGSYRKAANPVLRDTTERIIVASKGRFTRAIETKKRALTGLANQSTIGADEFLQATLDLWTLSPINATQVGHPAPFPIELPQRLIELYTFRGDVVLDPFIGSGTTAMAAVQTDRRYVGYDIDSAYIDLARTRITQQRLQINDHATAVPQTTSADSQWDVVNKLIAEGAGIRSVAEEWINATGYEIVSTKATNADLVPISFTCKDRDDVVVYVELAGTFATDPRGLTKQSVVNDLIAKAALLKARQPECKFLVLTTEQPKRHSANERMLRGANQTGMIDAIIDLRALLNF